MTRSFFVCVGAVKLLALFHRGRGLLLGALTRRAHVYVVGVNIVREKFRAAAAELKCSADDCYSFGTCCAHVRSFVGYVWYILYVECVRFVGFNPLSSQRMHPAAASTLLDMLFLLYGTIIGDTVSIVW